MKGIILTSILFSLTILVSSQTFLQENKTWNVVTCMNFSGCGTQSFRIIGDTTIGQIEYKKLYSTSDTTLTNWNLYGAMRENNNQVFIYNLYLETEELLYDFNLSVGDTFSTTVYTPDYVGCPINMVVTSIDTVILENNEPRQRFNFMGEQWVSGIGSLYGLIYVGVVECIIDMYYDLSCCYENNELIYQSQSFDNCFVNTVGLDENDNDIIKSVFPNPFSQSTLLKFDYSSSENYHLRIISVTGQVVMEIKDIKSGEVIIHGNQLNSGIHFYRVTKDEKVVASGKLIKN